MLLYSSVGFWGYFVCLSVASRKNQTNKQTNKTKQKTKSELAKKNQSISLPKPTQWLNICIVMFYEFCDKKLKWLIKQLL